MVLPTSESHPLVPGEYPPRDTGQEVQLGVKAREKQVPCSGRERSRLGGGGASCYVRAFRSVSARHSLTRARAWMMPGVGVGVGMGK